MLVISYKIYHLFLLNSGYLLPYILFLLINLIKWAAMGKWRNTLITPFRIYPAQWFCSSFMLHSMILIVIVFNIHCVRWYLLIIGNQSGVFVLKFRTHFFFRETQTNLKWMNIADSYFSQINHQTSYAILPNHREQTISGHKGTYFGI